MQTEREFLNGDAVLFLDTQCLPKEYCGICFIVTDSIWNNRKERWTYTISANVIGRGDIDISNISAMDIRRC